MKSQRIMLGAGCWVLSAGCWVLGAGCWVLGAGCWVLNIPNMSENIIDV
ncbi:phosphotransferase [Dokdonia sinensis]|nr:phosphotransferase [Dokdonia sinensis]